MNNPIVIHSIYGIVIFNIWLSDVISYHMLKWYTIPGIMGIVMKYLNLYSYENGLMTIPNWVYNLIDLTMAHIKKSFQHVKKNAGRNRWILKNQWNIVGIYWFCRDIIDTLEIILLPIGSPKKMQRCQCESPTLWHRVCYDIESGWWFQLMNVVIS
jgi:hypothetical protein